MKKLVLAGLLPAILGGCASALPPETTSYRSPVDAYDGIRDMRHRNALGEYTDRKAVSPKSWRRLNDQQAPGLGGRS